MNYTADHAGALADLTEAGAAVTFTLTSPGMYSEATDTFASSGVTTVAGYAIEVPGDPRQYAALELIQRDARTLLFAPSTVGSTPALGAALTWAGATFTVQSVQRVAPDGTAILSTVVVAR